MLHFWNDFVHRVKNKGHDTWAVACKNNSLLLIKNNREISKLNVDEIIEVITYKKDFLTYDPVFLCFVDKHGRTIEICEDMDGFDYFINNELAKHFDVEVDWFARVNKGAFAENRRVIWKI